MIKETGVFQLRSTEMMIRRRRRRSFFHQMKRE